MLYLTSPNNLISDAFFILDNRLMFASLHGRDADIWAFTASIQSGSRERLGFREQGDTVHFPMLTTASHFYDLHKRTTKYDTHNFGVLANMFVYASELVELNRDEKSGWVLMTDTACDLDKAVWSCFQQLSDVPLLDSWQHTLLADLSAQNCIRRYLPGITAEAAVVGVAAAKVLVPADFDERLTQLIREGKLLPS